jgi:competence protein ComFC
MENNINNRMNGILINGLTALNHLLWPKKCANCSCVIFDANSDFCSDCSQQLIALTSGHYCKRCGRNVSEYAISANGCPICLPEEFVFDAIARAGVYDGPLRNVILAFKRDSDKAKQTLTLLVNSALEGSPFPNDIELFVPVPLHWTSKINRGYNQSYLLAKRINNSAKVNTDLVRIRRTKMQTAMASPHQRLKNVEGAFAVRKGHSFEGKKICLVDDIKTTGATLNECAKTLKEAGAVKVYALVLAVADQRVD